MHKTLVDAYFEREAKSWDDIYRGGDVHSVIIQQRLTRALRWVDSLRLPPEASVLDIGCGAGITAVALAERGLRVHATDSVQSMLELTRRRAGAHGVDGHIKVRIGDATALAYEDASFDLVVALGLIPWVESHESVTAEIARVLTPDGAFIGAVANADRLTYALDPRMNPRLAAARKGFRRLLGPIGKRNIGSVRPRMLSPHDFDRLLSHTGIEKVDGFTYGFGPFTLVGRRVVPEPWALALHQHLQAHADRGARFLRSRGAQYVVLGRKRVDSLSSVRRHPEEIAASAAMSSER